MFGSLDCYVVNVRPSVVFVGRDFNSFPEYCGIASVRLLEGESIAVGACS